MIAAPYSGALLVALLTGGVPAEAGNAEVAVKGPWSIQTWRDKVTDERGCAAYYIHAQPMQPVTIIGDQLFIHPGVGGARDVTLRFGDAPAISRNTTPTERDQGVVILSARELAQAVRGGRLRARVTTWVRERQEVDVRLDESVLAALRACAGRTR